jgi:hypothetical protein
MVLMNEKTYLSISLSALSAGGYAPVNGGGGAGRAADRALVTVKSKMYLGNAPSANNGLLQQRCNYYELMIQTRKQAGE